MKTAASEKDWSNWQSLNLLPHHLHHPRSQKWKWTTAQGCDRSYTEIGGNQDMLTAYCGRNDLALRENCGAWA